MMFDLRMMGEHEFQLIVVWALLMSSVTQSIIHLTTYWALGEESDSDPYGKSLRERELSLGVKMFIRIFFDTMLILLVHRSLTSIPLGIRILVYAGLAIASIIAIIYGVKFINVLRTDNWGRPRLINMERQDDRARAQGDRQ